MRTGKLSAIRTVNDRCVPKVTRARKTKKFLAGRGIPDFYLTGYGFLVMRLARTRTGNLSAIWAECFSLSSFCW